MNNDANLFNRLFIHFVRYPSFRDLLHDSDPTMWRRLQRASIQANTHTTRRHQ